MRGRDANFIVWAMDKIFWHKFYRVKRPSFLFKHFKNVSPAMLKTRQVLRFGIKKTLRVDIQQQVIIEGAALKNCKGKYEINLAVIFQDMRSQFLFNNNNHKIQIKALTSSDFDIVTHRQ